MPVHLGYRAYCSASSSGSSERRTDSTQSFLHSSTITANTIREAADHAISILAAKPTHCRRCSTTKSIENLRYCTEKDSNQESDGARADLTSKVFIHQSAIFLMHV
ncbi:tRNA-specific 2-thiouridylase MnmA [Trichinella spiralis]|uniref:tRNA-specific 2-thiouridylase MnmA n=1 Tax=Trichinella spiralis TaxID=6334 RepID=A0ABR3KBW2_TRISP